MKIIFYDAKQYDIDSFEKQRKNYLDIESKYTLNACFLQKGYDANVTIFGTSQRIHKEKRYYYIFLHTDIYIISYLRTIVNL